MKQNLLLQLVLPYFVCFHTLVSQGLTVWAGLLSTSCYFVPAWLPPRPPLAAVAISSRVAAVMRLKTCKTIRIGWIGWAHSRSVGRKLVHFSRGDETSEKCQGFPRRQETICLSCCCCCCCSVFGASTEFETRDDDDTDADVETLLCHQPRRAFFFLVVVFSLFYFDRRQTVKKVKVSRSHLRVCVCVCVCERVKNNNTIAPRVYYWRRRWWGCRGLVYSHRQTNSYSQVRCR